MHRFPRSFLLVLRFSGQRIFGETYRNKDGSLRSNLSPRIKAAVLAAMLDAGGNREIVERLLDNPEGYNALANGLMQSAYLFLIFVFTMFSCGNIKFSQAAELFIEMRDKGQTAAEFEAQPDMFRQQPSAEVMFLCRLFEANQKTPSGISGVLNEYAAQCRKIDTATADLFGEEDPGKLEKLQSAYDRHATDLARGMGNLKALDRGSPAYAKHLTPEEIAGAKRQKAEVKAKWTNPDGSMKKGYMLAPNGKPTNLTEDQWLLVRTPNFKRWFGDWETLAIINEVENMPVMKISTHEALDKAGIKEVFKSFGEVENERDGRKVVFPAKSAGKIHYHKGFNTGEVIRNFKSLFETSIPIISEKEEFKEGHKVHQNIESYEHYINKFSANGNDSLYP